ncbi:MAG TPA: OmpH family outer membrane protein, partial [Gemmatimonadaceae bacterium]
MSSILRALVGAATVLAVSGAAPLVAQSASTPQRFAYVDTRLILDAAPGRAEAEAALQKEATGWDAEVKKMQDANIALITDFQKKSATMTQAERDKQTKYIQDKQAEWQKRNDSIQAVADRRKTEMLQPILDQIKLALEDVRKASGVDVIFDVNANNTIVAIDKNLNLSDRVIARLRVLGAPSIPVKAESPAKPAAPATKPSGVPIAAPSGIGRPPRTDTLSTGKKPDSLAP